MSNTESIEVSAATVEQAIQQALEQLGAIEDDVVIEVLANPRAGVLGLGARQAQVRVRRKPPLQARSGVTAPPSAPVPPRRSQPAPSPARETSRSGPPQSKGAPRPPRLKPQPPRPEPRSESSAAPVSETLGGTPGETMGEDSSDQPRRTANADEQVREASAILKRLLELMNEKSEIQRAEGDPQSLELEIRGDGSGILIGRHGQTLDALEYLLNRIVARRIRDAIPIQLDTESYRARRRQQLHRMALAMGEQAKREHAPVRMDPMPPRDRRIVHLALKDDPMLTTRSAGDGFLRTVEIVPAQGRPERGGGGREGKREEGKPNEKNPERERENPAIGEQGGFKHGQKRLF